MKAIRKRTLEICPRFFEAINGTSEQRTIIFPDSILGAEGGRCWQVHRIINGLHIKKDEFTAFLPGAISCVIITGLFFVFASLITNEIRISYKELVRISYKNISINRSGRFCYDWFLSSKRNKIGFHCRCFFLLSKMSLIAYVKDVNAIKSWNWFCFIAGYFSVDSLCSWWSIC